MLLAHSRPNDWSYPAFYNMGSGSIGLQIGGKVSEIVFIILTDKGLLRRIQPAHVHIYTLDRSPADDDLRPVPARRLREIAERVHADGFSAEVFVPRR